MKGWLSNKAENMEQSEIQKAMILQGASKEKVLGVAWNSHTDAFMFKVKPGLLYSQELILLSKRKIVSQVARIYDPIGFVSAFLIRAKIGLQELWKRGIDWDEELPPEMQKRWTRDVFSSLIPRKKWNAEK